MTDIIESKMLEQRDGFDLTAYKLPDHDSTPYDADCYDAVDIDAWKRGQWSYVGVEVVASREGVVLGTAYLGGVEDGYSPGFVDAEHRPDGYVDAWSHTLGNGEGDYDIPGDAIAEATEALRKLCAAK